MNRTIFFITAVVFCTMRAFAAQSTISPALENAIASAKQNARLSAIVYLHEKAEIESLDRMLTQQRATRQTRHQLIIDELRRVSAHSQASLLNELETYEQGGVIDGYTPYWITNCVVVRGLPAVFEEIAGRSDVEWIDVNFSAELIEPIHRSDRHREHSLDLNHGVPRGIRAVRAPEVWYQLGYTGAGRLVANLDTGVDGNHPALSARWRGNYAPADQCWHDEIASSAFPYDTHGHGTHTMGTMCGNSTLSNDSIGIAPGAMWIACSGIDQNPGDAFNNDVLDAYQWFADPDGNSQTIEDVPDVIQNSWGVSASFPGYEDCFNLWNNAIINCEAAGIVVLFSAGNSGPSPSSLGSPGNVAIDSVTMFAVGAVDATNDTIPPYTIASFSSRGPSDCPPGTAIKPEVVAPGVDVYSSFPTNNYTYLDGTSMAGPHVAGIVALMRQASPDAEVREIKSILMRSAYDYDPPGDDNTYGFGFVDAFAAIQALLVDRGFVTGIVRDAATMQPIARARVEAVGGGRGVTTHADGSYFITLLGDTTWTLRFSAFGYNAIELSAAVSIGDTTFLDISLTSAPLGTLQGIVRAGNSIPITAATVAFPGTPLNPILTDSAGQFRIMLPGGSAYDIATSYHDVFQNSTVQISAGQTTQLDVSLWSPRMQPTLADGYGYRSYDRYDTVYASHFGWLEITPALGGAGTLLEIQGRDSSAYCALPFPFRYYGQEYDSLTVNENGWIACGISHDHTFFNFPIPGLQGPTAMLASFWDNLSALGDNEISAFYDSLTSRYIIEYYQLQFLPPGISRLTFQVQIHDLAARPTPTGDNEIEFLYQRVDNASGCTVGLENLAENDGIQLLYNSEYNERTWQITTGASTRLSTRIDGYTGSLTGQISTRPPLSDYRNAVIRAGGKTVHAASNGTFSIDSLLTGIHRPTVQLAGYESFSGGILIGRDSISTLQAELWRLDPPRDFSGFFSDDAVFLQWRKPESVGGGSLDEFLQYRVLRNGSILGATPDTFFVDHNPPVGLNDYCAVAEYRGGLSDPSNHARIDVLSIDERSPDLLPTEFAIASIYPNPFNATATLRIAVPRLAPVKIEVYTLEGRHLETLLDKPLAAGYHQISWECCECSSALYLVVMTGGGKRTIEKAVLIR